MFCVRLVHVIRPVFRTGGFGLPTAYAGDSNRTIGGLVRSLTSLLLTLCLFYLLLSMGSEHIPYMKDLLIGYWSTIES